MNSIVDILKERLVNDKSLTYDQKKAIEIFIKAEEDKNKAFKGMIDNFFK